MILHSESEVDGVLDRDTRRLADERIANVAVHVVSTVSLAGDEIGREVCAPRADQRVLGGRELDLRREGERWSPSALDAKQILEGRLQIPGAGCCARGSRFRLDPGVEYRFDH